MKNGFWKLFDVNLSFANNMNIKTGDLYVTIISVNTKRIKMIVLLDLKADTLKKNGSIEKIVFSF